MESAAHQFICITELYELLLMHLAQGKSYERNDISVARLARVSKMTSNLALDLLWKNLSRPSQIIHLLPDDVYELTPNRKYNLTRPLVEGDFAVFDKYAPRVRSVDFASSFTGISAGCELFATLKSFRDPIFPHLLNFEWHPTAKFNTMGAFHLISREFNVPKDRFSLTMWNTVKVSDEPVQATANFATGPGSADTITLFRQPLSSWLPDVSSLVLQTGTYLQKAAILDGLASLSNLQHLDARLALDADILFHLAGLPNLKSLHMWEQENQTILTLRQTITQHGDTVVLGQAGKPAAWEGKIQYSKAK
ncbi:hypothetical protein C8R43DRAFT_1200399 [Mycena crocata]|nr:hypothetical protein C8R43DRAFT_1200399 [Mycena crocata]